MSSKYVCKEQRGWKKGIVTKNSVLFVIFDKMNEVCTCYRTAEAFSNVLSAFFNLLMTALMRQKHEL